MRGSVSAGYLFSGFEKSYDRLLASKTAEQGFAAIFESLNWIHSIDERFCLHTGGRRDWLEQTIGSQDSAGAQSLKAVRYARNSVHHQWGDAVEWRDGAEFPVNLSPGQRFGEWRWKPDIPEARSPLGGKQLYEQLLGGKSARLTIEYIAALFATHSHVVGVQKPRWLATE